MEVLSSRMLLRPSDLTRSHHFYRDLLGLAVVREFGAGDHLGLVFYLGNGHLEVSGRGESDPSDSLSLWMQVRDVETECDRLEKAGVSIVRTPRREPWGLIEAWIRDPDGVKIVLVEIAPDHPIRRDQRGAL